MAALLGDGQLHCGALNEHPELPLRMLNKVWYEGPADPIHWSSSLRRRTIRVQFSLVPSPVVRESASTHGLPCRGRCRRHLTHALLHTPKPARAGQANIEI